MNLQIDAIPRNEAIPFFSEDMEFQPFLSPLCEDFAVRAEEDAGGDGVFAVRGQDRLDVFRSDEEGRLPFTKEVRLADKGRDIAIHGLSVDLFGRADLHDLPPIHDDDSVAHGEGFGLIVGDEEHRDVELPLQLLDLAPHTGSKIRVEIRERFVEEEEFRIGGESPREGDPLLLSAAQLMDRTVAVSLQADGGKVFFRRTERLFLRQLSEVSNAVGNIFQDRVMGKEGIVLKDGGDISPLGRKVFNRFPVEENRPLIGQKEAAEEVEDGGLSAAGGAEKGDELAPLDGQPNVPHAVLFVKHLGQLIDFQKHLLSHLSFQYRRG